MNYPNVLYFLFLIFIVIKFTLNEEIKVTATNEVSAKCENSLYFIEIKVDFSSSFDNIYTFILELMTPQELKLKCSLTYLNKSILCFGNLNSNKYDLEIGEFIKLPRKFPQLDNITWDYDSFVKNIYEKEWFLIRDCIQQDFESQLKFEWGLTYNITNIYDNQCSYSTNSVDNKYNFKMKAHIMEGLLKKQIQNSNSNNFEIEFLQEIWVPILIDIRKGIFKKINDFSFAFCSTKEKITKLNLDYLIKDGLEFDCYIPISEGKLLIGAIQIKPFYDYLYMKINKEGENNEQIVLDNVFFNINRSFVHQYNISKNKNFYNQRYHDKNLFKNEMRMNEEMNGNETITYNSLLLENTNQINNNNIFNQDEIKIIVVTINYFTLGEITKIYCPDKPIFIISDINKGILLSSSNEKDYIFNLYGFLTNGQQLDFTFNSTIEIYDDIEFSLQVIDNLAEDEDSQKAKANCTIPSGTHFYRYISISCHAEKISEESMTTNDTDITLNWGLEKNRRHDDIIIQWPDEKKRTKHMYSYNIQGFSLAQSNYGCLNNDFYFYIYIFDLAFDTDITFEIKMKNPVEPNAKCKLYDSSILKCYFPLQQQKLEKFATIDLPINSKYTSIDESGNKVIFFVDDYEYDYEDFHITLREECGDYMIVGALKKAGFDIFKVFLIVVGILAFVFIVFVCFICYICYKIKHRNKKGIYVKHIEEDINTNNIINKGNEKDKAKKIELVSSRSVGKK